MANSVRTFDVVVLGAGIIGASCALRLAKQHPSWNIAVVERAAKSAAPVGQNEKVLALGKLAQEVLDAIGVLESLSDENCFAYTAMRVWDESSEGELVFDAREFDQINLGVMVDAQFCTYLLQQRLEEQANITPIFDQTPQAINFRSNPTELKLIDHSISASLLIAADGGNSWARQQAKIFAPVQSFDQLGIVAKIKLEKDHQNTAWQRFLPTGPLAVLPLHNNEGSIVWSVDTERANQLLALKDEAFEEQMENAFESALGAMQLETPRQAFPLRSRHAEAYIRRGFALIGDAAHSIHPLAGQGANLGFKDIECLAEQLEGLPQSDLGELNSLSRYQRKRKVDNQQTDLLMNVLHEAYRNQLPLWQAARGKGMNWISSNSAIKALLVRQAIGA